MRWRKKRNHDEEPGNGVSEARAEREAAERRLAETEEHLAVPLKEIRREDHIGPFIDELIDRSVRRRYGGDPGAAAH